MADEQTKTSSTDRKTKIRELRNRIKEVGRKGKLNFEKEWFRNILFFVGQQWIIWDKGERRWKPGSFDEWYPTPVTNKFASAVTTLKSILIQEEPRMLVTPETDDDADIATAQIGDSFVDVVKVETDEQTVNAIASSWIILTANVFFHEYYYTSKEFGTTKFPMMRCNDCGTKMEPDAAAAGVCECGSQNIGESIDASGNPETIEMPHGRLREDSCSPFEMFFDQEIENFKDVREIVRAKIKPTQEWKELYPQFADDIKPDGQGEGQSEMYTKALAHLTSTGTKNSPLQSSGAGIVDTTTGDYVFSLPCKDFPNGVMATMIGDVVVEDYDLADVHVKRLGESMVPYLPFVPCGATRVPGRSYHKTVMDDVISKQIQRNMWESFFTLHTMTMSAGKWLEPDGAEMDTPTARPGQRIRYTPVNGMKPELLAGIPPPAHLLEFIKLIDADIEDITKSFDVLKGQLPPGLDTFAGLRLLTERAFSNHNEMIRNWERACEERTKMKLELARQHMTEPRKRTVRNQNGSWETKQFTKADLQGGINIKVEVGSSTPRSQATENAAVIDSIKMGLIDPSNPHTLYKVLEKLGQADLMAPIGEDIKDAMREWKVFLDSVMENPTNQGAWILRPRHGIDNELVHYNDAAARAKTEEFFELPIEAQNMWIEHATMHKMWLDQEAQQQAMMAAPAAKPGAGPAAPPAPGRPGSAQIKPGEKAAPGPMDKPTLSPGQPA